MIYRTILITALLLLTGTRGFAQWNYHTTLATTASNDFVDVDFATENSGIYCTDHYLSPSSGYSTDAFSSANGGLNWSGSYSASGLGLTSYAVHAVKNTTTCFYISNDQGFYRIRKSTNNGNNWSLMTSGQGWHQGFSAVGTTHAYFISDWGGTYLHKYVNGTITNNIYTFPNNVYPTSVLFTDTLVGYVVASKQAYQKNRFILRSGNAGTAWSTVFSDSLFNINGIHFPNRLTGYAVGDSGKIVKTTDGGQNWSYLQSNTTKNLRSTFFINDSVGYAAGNSGLIINTVNGGITWNQQTTGTTLGFKKVFFVNDSIGFALADNQLYKIKRPVIVGVKDIQSESGQSIAVYPNPNHGIFHVKTGNNESSIEITNALGEIILKKAKGSMGITIDLSDREPGLYFIRELKNGKIAGRAKVLYSAK